MSSVKCWPFCRGRDELKLWLAFSKITVCSCDCWVPKYCFRSEKLCIMIVKRSIDEGNKCGENIRKFRDISWKKTWLVLNISVDICMIFRQNLLQNGTCFSTVYTLYRSHVLFFLQYMYIHINKRNIFCYIYTQYNYLNLSLPSATYLRQWIWRALVQIMAWCLFGAKPLSKPTLGYCPLDTWEQTSVKF